MKPPNTKARRALREKAPPKPVDIHQAKTHLSKLVARVQKGEEIVIAKAGKPVARLVPIEREKPTKRVLGTERGIWIAPDFDTFIPPEWEVAVNAPIDPPPADPPSRDA